MYEKIKGQAAQAMEELLQAARLHPGDLVVVGCSTSEVAGEKIGSASSPEIAAALLEELYAPLKREGLFLAAQCCEHLNRALVLEEEVLHKLGLPQVNVVPQPKAGGSFATAVWQAMRHPAATESLQAAAGLDIGSTLIGMHLRPVAVPVRLGIKAIGEAPLTAARTRPKFIGGARAVYNDTLK